MDWHRDRQINETGESRIDLKHGNLKYDKENISNQLKENGLFNKSSIKIVDFCFIFTPKLQIYHKS